VPLEDVDYLVRLAFLYDGKCRMHDRFASIVIGERYFDLEEPTHISSLTFPGGLRLLEKNQKLFVNVFTRTVFLPGRKLQTHNPVSNFGKSSSC